MNHIQVNMAHYRDKWVTYQDNSECSEIILLTCGNFSTFYPDRYTHWLNEFNIFYTATTKAQSYENKR